MSCPYASDGFVCTPSPRHLEVVQPGRVVITLILTLTLTHGQVEVVQPGRVVITSLGGSALAADGCRHLALIVTLTLTREEGGHTHDD